MQWILLGGYNAVNLVFRISCTFVANLTNSFVAPCSWYWFYTKVSYDYFFQLVHMVPKSIHCWYLLLFIDHHCSVFGKGAISEKISTQLLSFDF
jgi:hypothetical protein